MPTILAFGGGGGGMKFIRAAATGSGTSIQPYGYTAQKYKDGSWAWYNSDNNLLYFYTGSQWRAVNTYQ